MSQFEQRFLQVFMFLLMLAAVGLMVAGYTHGRPAIVTVNTFNALACIIAIACLQLMKVDKK